MLNSYHRNRQFFVRKMKLLAKHLEKVAKPFKFKILEEEEVEIELFMNCIREQKKISFNNGKLGLITSNNFIKP